MNTKVESENRSLIQFHKRAFVGGIALMLFLSVDARGGGVVSECTEASLRAAMEGGGTVTFACDGVILKGFGTPISVRTDTILDGSGHQITISGRGEGLFHVSAGVTFAIMNLTIANSQTSYGDCVGNLGGTLNLVGVGFYTNDAGAYANPSDQVAGGAIVNRGGTVNATNCIFSGNRVRVLPPASGGSTWKGGGAIRNESGQMKLVQCVFTGNRADGVMGTATSPDIPPVPGPAAGGAIQNNGTLTLDLCTFANNSAIGRDAPGAYIHYLGATGAAGVGGAILNLGTLVASRANFVANIATSGNGGAGGSDDPRTGPGGNRGGPGGLASGGAIFNLGTLSVNATTFASNTASGGMGGAGSWGPSAFGFVGPGFRGGSGGAGQGAAIFNGGTTLVDNSTFAWNSALGGVGGPGGSGGSSTTGSGAGGGPGGDGGVAWGAICDTTGLLSLTNCTVAFNQGIGGRGGAGGAGGSGTPPGQPGPAGTNGVAGGGIRSTGGRLVNTLLATNTPGGNSIGPLIDAGHNLSSDASCAFTNIGSLNNTDPLLASLADNGAPTLTMALLPGSPAIDAGDNAAAPTSDQRGHPRPVGLAADIGAYEYGTTPRLSIGLPLAGTVEVLLCDASGPSCRLFTSATLTDWQCVATNQIGADGTALFQDNCGTVETRRFYRVVIP